nr:SEP9 [Phytophthora capsici]
MDTRRKPALLILLGVLSAVCEEDHPMAKVWRIGVTKGSALGHAETNRKPTCKPRKAAAIRAAKKGRAASRAATGTIGATDTLRLEPTVMSMEESSGAEARARQSNPTAVASQPLSDVTKAREKSYTLRARWACPICSNVNLACFLRCSKC